MASARLIAFWLIGLLLLAAAYSGTRAQSGRTTPAAVPMPTPQDEQEPVRVFTEEVILPVIAFDDYGNFDPTLEPTDLSVFEDGVQQEIRSVRRVPASVLLLLGTGGEMNPAMRTSTTRETAERITAALGPDDHVAILQFTNRIEVLQPWTVDAEAATHVLRTKLHSGHGSRLADAVSAAAAYFVTQPLGNRHLVLITDGVELPVGRAGYKEALEMLTAANDGAGKQEWEAAVRRLLASQASVHVISYTEYGRLALKGETRKYQGSNAPPGSVRASGIQNVGIDSTLPPTQSRAGSDPARGDGINFDPQMKRLRKAYEKALKRGEPRLAALAEETGARLFKPESADEMIAQGSQVAREIGAQYVVTYVPKRPLAEARPGEYRRVQIAPRKAGLTVRTRRGYIASPAK